MSETKQTICDIIEGYERQIRELTRANAELLGQLKTLGNQNDELLDQVHALSHDDALA